MKTRIPPCTTSGFIVLPLRGWLFLISIGLLWGGGQALYTGLKNRQPLTITCKDYIDQSPSAEWLTLTDASISVLESAYTTKYGVPSELYIPVRPASGTRSKSVHVLLLSKDKAMLADIAAAAKEKSLSSAGIKVMQKYMDKYLKPQEVRGLVQFGIDADDKTKKKLQGLSMDLANDFVIIKEGETPSAGLGIGLVLAGLVLGFLSVRRMGSANSAPASTPPPLPGRSSPPVPPVRKF